MGMGFQRFTQRAAHAASVPMLAAAVLDETGEIVNAQKIGFYAFRRADAPEMHVRNVPTSVLERYEAVGRSHDPVLAGVTESHVPCAMSLRQLVAHARVNRYPDAFLDLLDCQFGVENPGLHCMQAPIVVDGEVAGTLNFARVEDRPFDAGELAIASAISLHVSTRLAALRALVHGVDRSWEELLTPRGLDVAELAARGLTMAEVGLALGVSANTAKKHLRIVYERLGVASRAELASVLVQKSPEPLPRMRGADADRRQR